MSVQRVDVGQIVGVFGIKGWVKINSFTRPKENILTYSPWYLVDGEASVERRIAEGNLHGKGIIVRLEGVSGREEAARFCGKGIYVRRSQLPAADVGEYYWADLVGLKVRTVSGQDLGTVDHLIETGANDVLVVKGERERLIPFLQERYVIDVDLMGGIITADWDPEF
ncbi:MAG: ribosome maturation factor RimM [Pseudomonadota bacterium]